MMRREWFGFRTVTPGSDIWHARCAAVWAKRYPKKD